MLPVAIYALKVGFLSSKESPKFVPTQRFVGMEVVDIRGVMVGNVKDVSVDFQNKALAFRVTAKNNTELDMQWDDILSVEDVVLLKKNVDLATSAPSTLPSTSTQATAKTQVICSNCGASSPPHAKFCPKCGSSMIR